MVGLALIVVIAIVGSVVYVTGRSHPSADGPAAPARPASKVPVYAEALGYIGAMLALGGLLTVLGDSWNDLAEGVRLAIGGIGAVALLGAGAALPVDRDPAFARLRGVTWLASTAAAAVFAGVLVGNILDVSTGQTIAFACSATVAVESALLWRGRSGLPLQQLTALGGAAVAVGTFASQWTESGPAGVPVWIVGAALVALATRRILTPHPAITVGVGSLALIIGASMTSDSNQGVGLLFVVVTASGLLALALVPGVSPSRSEQAVAGVLGAFGLLFSLPPTLGHFARDAGAVTGTLVWLIGTGLIVVGARHRVRAAVFVEAIGALTTIGGAALIGVQWPGAAPLLGIASAVALIVVGTRPGRVLLSAFGSLGLLVNVPWAISWFFPGEGRAPLLISVSGLLLVGIALYLARSGSRWRSELGGDEGEERAGGDVPPPPVPTGAATGPAA